MALMGQQDLANPPQSESRLVICASVAPGNAAEVVDGSICEVIWRVDNPRPPLLGPTLLSLKLVKFISPISFLVHTVHTEPHKGRVCVANFLLVPQSDV